ncbi:hypothetical protein B0T10DRAFT_177448 [Thelonectria olida]|uniref:Ricin B lectin domain-containing protein n=1 Tax=Thelonectria olida TaxID=1576542 RepID=A0A9P8WF22_9HYPO|nr:hypothetical protein B0T10DRAFT_177448 [Thelonectria olida]
MSSLDPVSLDSNVWYHVTEYRVDIYAKENFTSSLQVEDDNGVAVWGAVDQYWQFQPVPDAPDGRYALRCSKTGVFKQLSACYVGDEIDDSKTQPCMRASDGTKAQMWDVADWGNGTYRFVNAKNGSDYVMDVHPGNPPFMASDLRTDIPQPGRHWLMTSVKDVDDGAYSTTFTKVPTSTAADATTTDSSEASQTADSAVDSNSSPSSPSSSKGLSPGAAAGIGIGVALAVLGLGIALFTLWWRRRHRTEATEMPATHDERKPPVSAYHGPYPQYPLPPQEMSVGEYLHPELDSKPVWGSTASTASPQTHNSPESHNSRLTASPGRPAPPPVR